MLHDTPLRERHEHYLRKTAGEPAVDVSAAHRPGAATGQHIGPQDVEYIPYGPRDETGEPSCEIVATFGEVEAEYAAIRRGAALMDLPQRGTLRLTGSERCDFLQRMMTNDLSSLQPGRSVSTFWLNRQGRIEADLTLVELGEQMLASLSVHQAVSVVNSIDAYVFTEDIEIQNASDEFHHLAVHGPLALDVLQRGSDLNDQLESGRCAQLNIADVSVVAMREDTTGEPGVTLITPYEQAGLVWDALLATDETLGEGRRRIRPIGWYAFNIARIEAGTPMLNIDFGTNNLPHETGLLRERVNFNKGCFLGQEVVARMENLGRPKQTLIGFKAAGDLLPESGAQVFEKSEGETAMGRQIGMVTSSTLSPMLGGAPIGFAMLKTKYAEQGTTVVMNAEGDQTEAQLTKLRFWSREPDDQQESEIS